MSKIIRVDKFGREIQTPIRPGKRGMRKFRMHARRFLLTYSRVPESLPWESVVKQLQNNLGFEKYAVVRERHMQRQEVPYKHQGTIQWGACTDRTAFGRKSESVGDRPYPARLP